MAAKLFEVGDVLPATTQLRISWDSGLSSFLNRDAEYRIQLLYNSIALIIVGDFNLDAERTVLRVRNGTGTTPSNWVNIYEVSFDYPDGWISPYTDYSGGHNYVDIDTSLWDTTQRTIKSIARNFQDTDLSSLDCFYWEDLNAPSGYSITFEENDGTNVTDLTEQIALPNPLPTTTKANHVFAGWYYDNLFTQKATAGDELTTNVTLYAKWYTPTTWCEDIADAIREKDGTTEPIKHLDFPERILAIENGIDVSDANATVSDVLSGKTFYAVDDTKKTGTMPNHGTVSTDITTKAQEVTIQQGYHSGSGKVKISATEQAKIIASNIKSGVTILGQAGAVTPAKEEQTKTVSPTTSSQDVLPDSGKVLSKVTVNAIPTETKSQQPNLSSGNQTINATSGKFMTSFTITKDTINHIASNIRSGITLYGVTGNLQPAKEEETKTVTPNFASGNVVVTPTSGKVLTSVTLIKPTDLIPENIAKDKNVCGVVGTSFIAVELTQTQYDALETKDANTYYLING